MVNIDKLPYFIEPSNLKKWCYKLKEPIHFQLFPKYINLSILDKNGKLLGRLYKDGRLEIYPGFCWDGATCAPDVPEVLRASLVHDIMCQLVNHENWPYERSDADYEFRRICREDNFKYRLIYFIAVLLFGMVKEIFLPNKKYPGITTRIE